MIDPAHSQRRDPDAIVIGSGPNGLVAAAVLARAGWNVLVLEAHPTRAGGGVGSEQSTIPGFVHDVGAAFFPWGGISPAFGELELERHGLTWCRAPVESCHPAPDGSYALIARDDDYSARHFGSSSDGDKWREVMAFYRRIETRLVDVLLRPFPAVIPTLKLLPLDLLKVAAIFASRAGSLAKRWFASEAARRVLPGLGLHVDVGPDDRFGAALGFMLGVTGASGGYAVPAGGAQSITNALLGIIGDAGGRVQLGTRVERLIVHDGQVHGVRLSDGDELRCACVLADTDAAALYLHLLDREYVPGRVVDFMQRFPRGWGTFKMDWALSSAVPWSVEAARRSAVVHAGDSLSDLSRFTTEVRNGQLPGNPYLVIGQQSLADPTRAPTGQHTLWAYSRVPSRPPTGDWSHAREAFADRIEARIEAMAPGFRDTILARRSVAPPDLEAMDENLVGGDLGGGSNAWHRQLLFRPVFPYFRYRTPVRGVYLCSSYAHPGAGVHGMCGFNAAKFALRDAR